MDVGALLVAAFMWVCGNSDFECKAKTMEDLPAVQFVEYDELHMMMTDEVWAGVDRDYIAAYRMGGNVIYIDKGWEETVPGLSLEEILVHEVVHVLQDKEGPWPECLVAAELQAYELQVKWQRQRGEPEWLNGLWLMMLKEEGCR